MIFFFHCWQLQFSGDLCLALIAGTKNPHDFYSMDLNLGKHYAIWKLFLNLTKLLRRAGRGGSVLEIAKELRY